MLDISLMIVEDDEQLRKTLSRILSREIKLVKSFPQPSEALKALTSYRPDIIITDIKMPGMTGLDMMNIINGMYHDIPVIILSAFSEPEYFIKAIDLKVHHFLTKPVDTTKLIEMIGEISKDLSVKNELKEQRRLLDQYKEIVDISSHITITDKKGIIIYVNDKFCELSGYSREELLGKSHNIVRHPDVPSSLYKELWNTILSKRVWQGIIKNRAKDGSDFYIDTTIAPILDKDGEIIEFISIKTDITSLIKSKQRLQEQIITDKLTNLPNRIKLQEDLREGNEATLIVFDINHFKEINSLFGVDLGDEALIYIAKTIQNLNSSLKNAQVYRISADEFAIHKAEECVEEFKKFAYTLHDYIEENPFSYQQISFDITFTCAVAYKENQSKNLIEAVLDALDSAKKAKHFLHVFDESASKQHEYEQNFQWSRKIKEALNEGRIKAYFQPIYSLRYNSIVKYESLVRLIERDGAIVSPSVFLKIAKHSRFYNEITRTMITQGCSVFANRKEILTINMSIEDLLDEETIDFFINTVHQNNMQGRIVAEVLESEGIENFDIFNSVLSKLKNNGIKIAIDDFGSGYSNFSYLINMKIDILKIDGSLIENIDVNINSKVIVQSIVMFARELKMSMIAEFVCSEAVFERVRALGVDMVQGYYISEPIPEPLPEDSVIDI